MGLPKDLTKLLKDAKRNGWMFIKGRKHIKGKHVSGKTATISFSPSDWHALANIKKDLEVHGNPGK